MDLTSYYFEHHSLHPLTPILLGNVFTKGCSNETILKLHVVYFMGLYFLEICIENHIETFQRCSILSCSSQLDEVSQIENSGSSQVLGFRSAWERRKKVRHKCISDSFTGNCKTYSTIPDTSEGLKYSVYLAGIGSWLSIDWAQTSRRSLKNVERDSPGNWCCNLVYDWLVIWLYYTYLPQNCNQGQN